MVVAGVGDPGRRGCIFRTGVSDPGYRTEPGYREERFIPRCPQVVGAPIADAGQQFYHPFESHFVARIRDKTDERDHIFNMGLLEETDAAGNLIGNAATRQLELQFDRMIVRAIEHRDIV